MALSSCRRRSVGRRSTCAAMPAASPAASSILRRGRWITSRVSSSAPLRSASSTTMIAVASVGVEPQGRAR